MARTLSILATRLLNSDALQRLVGAPVCLLCGVNAGREGLCSGCREALPRMPPVRCPTCASPLPMEITCGRCIAHSPVVDRVEAALVYTFPVDGLVQALKYRHHLAVAHCLGHLLADALKDAPRPDLVMAVPLGAQRLAERGFNQSLEIARVTAKLLELPLEAEGCRRIRDTPPQAALAFDERAKNVRRAFVCDMDLTGLRVALVDDVLTTGASLNECARALKKSGAAQVIGWVAARTLLEQ
jgi:ComF family protein